MFRSLLVPLDGSTGSSAAVPVARAIATATGGSLTLVRVASDGDAENREAEGHVAEGDVPGQVRLCADAVGADMIVMSAHTIHWPGDAMMSSVAGAVLRTGN